ncbi:MAG TPA: Ku protein [Candidatus Angelobacter sp.]|jgi:DNA end-binding protein Ku|nr:Ku protein [Candidatus Angelobacter sp.]
MASTVWKGQLNFGFISLPVKFTSAAKAESVSFNQLHKTDHSRVKQVMFCAAEGKQIERSEIVKGYEYEKDKYIEITSEDLDKIAPDTAETMDLLEFVDAKEMDAVYFESSYYLVPEKGGEKAYSLLHMVMLKTGTLAVTKIAMHSREHVAVLRPGARGIVLQTLFYHDEVRATTEFRPDAELVSKADVEMAAKLVESLSAPWEPEKYKDGYREKLAELVQAKVTGKTLEKGKKNGRKSEVVDIQTALKKSIEAAKAQKKTTAITTKKQKA